MQVEGVSQELGKREEELEALASALAQKDTEVARMVEELGKLQSRGSWEAVDSSGDLWVERGTSPAYQQALPGSKGAEELAKEVEQQRNTIKCLQVGCRTAT